MTDTTALWIARMGIVLTQTRRWNTLWKWRARLTKKFENEELAEFLEDAVEALFALDPDCIGIVAISDSKGIAGTNYYNAGIQDKGAMITHIIEDIIDDFIQNNAERIRSIILGDEIDGEDDEIDE